MKIAELLLEGKKALSDGKPLSSGSETSGLEEKVRNASCALDAEVLLAHVLDMSREELMRDSSEEVSEDEQALYLKYIEQVLNGRPIAYIAGKKEFYGMDFYVDERVLIPRPETEMIVDEVLDWLGGRSCSEDAEGVEDVDLTEEIRMLDVGTGSLNITSAIIRHYGHIYAHAIDISDDALEVARINVESHGLETHVEIYQSDLLSAVDEVDFDIIVTNLPYIGEKVNRNVSANVEKYEPSSALFGGVDGLELYKKLIQQILDKKIDFKLLVGEFGFGQASDVKLMLNKFFEQGFEWEIKSDLAGILRIFVVRKV